MKTTSKKISLFNLSCLVLAGLITFSCSKQSEEDLTKPLEQMTAPIEIEGIQVESSPIKTQMEVLPEGHWQNLKSTNAPAINRYERYTPYSTLYSRNYYVNYNSQLIAEYYYMANGDFKGGFYYDYNTNGTLFKTSKYDNYGYLVEYCIYAYYSDNRVAWIAKYLATGEFKGYIYFIYTNGLITKTRQYSSTGVNQGEDEFLYNSSNQMVTINHGSWQQIFSYNSLGQVYHEKIMAAYAGFEFSKAWSRSSGSYLVFGYDHNTWTEYVRYYLEPGSSNYDPSNPLDIFKLNSYYYSYY